MTTFANAAFATGIQPMEKPALELDGTAVRALAAALPAFAGKAPGSKLDDYIVHVNPAEDGLVQVVFVLGGADVEQRAVQICRCGPRDVKRVVFWQGGFKGLGKGRQLSLDARWNHEPDEIPCHR